MYFENKKGLKAETIGDATLPNIDKILFDVEKFIAMIEQKTGKPINSLVRASINSAIREINVQYSKTDYEKNLTDAVRKSSDKIRESINTIHSNLKDLVQSIIDEKPDRTSAELKDELLNRTSDKFSKVYTVSRINAIAQTTSNFAFNSAQNTVFKDLGFNKIWLSQRDSKVRTSHRFADSQKADKDGFFHVGNDKMLHPNAGSIASENVHCRCYMLAQKAIDAPKPEPKPEPKPVKPRKPRTPKPKPVTPAGLNSIDDILTVSDANKYLLEKHGIENLGVEFDVNQLKIFLRELELVKNEYDTPQLKYLTSNTNALASVDEDSKFFNINKKLFKGGASEREDWKNSQSSKFFYTGNFDDLTKTIGNLEPHVERNFHPIVLGDDLESILTHEFGHVLTNIEFKSSWNGVRGFGEPLFDEIDAVKKAYFAEYGALKDVSDKLENDLIHLIKVTVANNNNNWDLQLKDIDSAILKKLKQYSDDLVENEKKIDKIFISKYAEKKYSAPLESDATKGIHEFTAESFAIGTKKPNTNKYADEVVSIIKKYKGKKK